MDIKLSISKKPFAFQEEFSHSHSAVYIIQLIQQNLSIPAKRKYDILQDVCRMSPDRLDKLIRLLELEKLVFSRLEAQHPKKIGNLRAKIEKAFHELYFIYCLN